MAKGIDRSVRTSVRCEKERRGAWYHELVKAMTAEDIDFVPLDATEILAEAKRRRKARANRLIGDIDPGGD